MAHFRPSPTPRLRHCWEAMVVWVGWKNRFTNVQYSKIVVISCRLARFVLYTFDIYARSTLSVTDRRVNVIRIRVWYTRELSTKSKRPPAVCAGRRRRLFLCKPTVKADIVNRGAIVKTNIVNCAAIVSIALAAGTRRRGRFVIVLFCSTPSCTVGPNGFDGIGGGEFSFFTVSLYTARDQVQRGIYAHVRSNDEEIIAIDLSRVSLAFDGRTKHFVLWNARGSNFPISAFSTTVLCATTEQRVSNSKFPLGKSFCKSRVCSPSKITRIFVPARLTDTLIPVCVYVFLFLRTVDSVPCASLLWSCHFHSSTGDDNTTSSTADITTVVVSRRYPHNGYVKKARLFGPIRFAIFLLYHGLGRRKYVLKHVLHVQRPYVFDLLRRKNVVRFIVPRDNKCTSVFASRNERRIVKFVTSGLFISRFSYTCKMAIGTLLTLYRRPKPVRSCCGSQTTEQLLLSLRNKFIRFFSRTLPVCTGHIHCYHTRGLNRP